MASIDENFVVKTGLTVGTTTITASTGVINTTSNIVVGTTVINGATGSITVGNTTIDGSTGAISTPTLTVGSQTVSTFANVATTGSYNDLSDKPTITTYSAATGSVLGVVKVGDNLALAGDGTVSLTSGNVTAALGYTPVNSTAVGAVNGVATLDVNGQLTADQLPTAVVGAMVYQGTWNATTNIPAIIPSTGTKGRFYVVGTAGNTTIDGNNSWTVGDIIAYNGATWDKIQGGASDVVSVAGLVGAPTAAQLATALSGQTMNIAGSSSSCTGNAATATSAGYWTTSRTITLGGDLTGSVAINGSANATLTAAIAANSVALGTDTTGNYVTSIANGAYITGGAAGSEGAALTLAVDATSANTASKVVARDASGNFSAGTITATLSGNATSATTASTANATATGNNFQMNSLGVGTTGSGTAGEIRATNNVTAYYSDDRLKTKLGNIESALEKLCTLNGFYYEANATAQALGYEPIREVGVSAQQVQAIMPEVVAPAPIDDKYLTVRYERLMPLVIEAIKELKAEFDKIKG